jgi:S-adenosylmethionine:tRNA ribosyltransferase-isomerase
MYELEDYNYDLPHELIAQVPASRRDESRLLVIDRKGRFFSHFHFCDLPALLKRGDLLVINDTKVAPARLFGRKESGGRVEILVLDHPESAGPRSDTRTCLLKSSKRPSNGSFLFFESGVTGQIKELRDNGLVSIAFRGPRSIDSLLEEKGQMPLPPYIRRVEGDPLSQLDKERYQTIFSEKKGAVAAPTAGLHFTGEVIEGLKQSGISIAPLTLRVGYGTFRPVRTRDIRRHFLGEESYQIGQSTAEAVERTRKGGGRVVAVGTTVVRTLETALSADGRIISGKGRTELLITPGFVFRAVDALITNFHLPKSSLLFLVSAFAGRDLIKRAYDLAIEEGYRFYSYGDAMLIL